MPQAGSTRAVRRTTRLAVTVEPPEKLLMLSSSAQHFHTIAVVVVLAAAAGIQAFLIQWVGQFRPYGGGGGGCISLCRKARSFSRTSQRRSQVCPVLGALTRSRNSVVPSTIISVTCIF